MQEEILQLYEKIKDQLSEEEFNAEIEELRKSYGDVDFMNDVDLARMILGNYGIEVPKVISKDDDENSIVEATNDNSIESVENTEFTMTEELKEFYDKVNDKITEDEFFKRMNLFKNENIDNPFMSDVDFAKMVVDELEDKEEEVEVISERPEYAADTIDKLEDGSKDVNVEGRVTSISSRRSFKTRKGKEGEVCNVELQDNTGKMRCVFWTPNMPLLKKFKEGDIIQIKMVDIKEGYSGLEANLRPRSTIAHIEDDPSKFPPFEEIVRGITVESIDKLKDGSKEVNIEGRVTSISNKRSFKTRKGGEGEVCNVELQDNTGTVRCVFWTQNMPLLDEFSEGDTIQIKKVDIKDGYFGLEANLLQGSTIVRIEDDSSRFPVYEETITAIADIEPDTKVNIIARILRIPTIRSYEKNGKQGKVASLELQDATGKITYTLWNKNVELIEDLKLEDGDTVKVIAANARERVNRDGDSEISLTHWDGRIIKGDFDVPEIEQEFYQIGDLTEQSDVSIKGVVIRLQDIKTFIRKTDNSEGRLRNFDVSDATGAIRVTVWGDDTALPINKGDIVKIMGGDVRFDDYTESGYSMNTNFNTQITINPENLTIEELDEFEGIKEQLVPVPIGSIGEIDDEGKEIDVVGRILSVNDVNEFQRDDGSVGVVRSVMFADESGKVRLSFWNERAQEEYVVGDAYQIENARTRLGMMSVDLNIGSGSRVIKLSEEEASARFIPELSTLEKTIYNPKKIEDLDEDEEDTIIIGRIIEINDLRTFDRDNGEGHVRNIEIADDTGVIRVALWDKDALKEREIGDGIKLQNPRLALNMDNRLEANVSNATTILEPSESELEKLPSIDELMAEIYTPKTIESLLEDDTNVCVTGTIKEVSTQRVLLKRCPSCNQSVEETIDEYVCDNCGYTFDEPDYLLMVPTRIEDDTGDIQVTFFDKLAEELIGMKKEEIISLLDDGYDIEDKLEDLNGLTIEIIANVSFDEFNEENRLSPKKIINKYF